MNIVNKYNKWKYFKTYIRYVYQINIVNTYKSVHIFNNYMKINTSIKWIYWANSDKKEIYEHDTTRHDRHDTTRNDTIRPTRPTRLDTTRHDTTRPTGHDTTRRDTTRHDMMLRIWIIMITILIPITYIIELCALAMLDLVFFAKCRLPWAVDLRIRRIRAVFQNLWITQVKPWFERT